MFSFINFFIYELKNGVHWEVLNLKTNNFRMMPDNKDMLKNVIVINKFLTI